MPDLTLTPDLPGFLALAVGRRVISVHTRLLADDLTAVGLYHQLCGERENTFLLESADNGMWSRWSFVGVNAVATLSERDGQAFWSGREIVGLPTGGDPLRVLEQTLQILHTPTDDTLPPLVSGMVGYLAYDIVRRLEVLPDANPDDLHLPELVMMLVSDMAILDHHTGEIWLVANAINFDDAPQRAEQAWTDARDRVHAMAARLRQPVAPVIAVRDEQTDAPTVVRQSTAPEYMAAVAAAVEEIRAGEAFQIVPSQRFDLPTDADPLDIYRILRRTNPSPYLYLLRLPGMAVVGSSPEALVTVQNGRAETHPIAGSAAGGDRGVRCRDGDGTTRRSQGTRRAPDAGGPRPQRPGPGLQAGHGGGDRVHAPDLVRHHPRYVHVDGHRAYVPARAGSHELRTGSGECKRDLRPGLGSDMPPGDPWSTDMVETFLNWMTDGYPKGIPSVTKPVTALAGSAASRIRKDVNSLSGAELDKVKRAFEGIIAKDPSDQNSYFVQAGYHWLPPPLYCQHHVPAYNPWHRAYLVSFENAMRSVPDCGGCLTLPYWDITTPFPDVLKSPPFDKYTLPQDIGGGTSTRLRYSAIRLCYHPEQSGHVRGHQRPQ